MESNVIDKRTKGEWSVSLTTNNEIVAYPNKGKKGMLNMPLKVATARLSNSISGMVNSIEEANANAAFICHAVNSYDTLLEHNNRFKKALEAIAAWAGNLPDERYLSRTGANDAALRGSMVVSMRQIAKNALI